MAQKFKPLLTIGSMLFGSLAWPVCAQSVTAPTTVSAIAARPQLSGERLFIQCRACHSLTSEQSGKVGPSLSGLFSRGTANAPGYTYSPALRAYGGAWTEARLDAFLTGPNRTIAGTKMAFAGIPDATRRATLIAYLKANTGTGPASK